MKLTTRSRWFRRILTASLASVSLAAIGCSSDVVTGSTVVPEATGSPTVQVASSAEATIEFTPDGFVPDQVEVAEGSRVMLRNTTDDTAKFVIQGREDGASADEHTIEPGQSVDLGLVRAGAYIVMLSDDPLVTAGVFIS